jgi:hypothetical protein
MTKTFFFIALCLGFANSFAQSTINMVVKQTREAQYVQGDAAVDQYFFDNLHYSDEAKHAKVDTEVMLSFMVEVDSTVSTVKVIRDPGFGVGESLKELALKMKYIPALENGVPMRSKVLLNIPVRAH